ncbi:hypothetical protein EJB05_48781 [Eragrostis curvula]|uniref:F-box domain-containing protein n=1 Tax=Eragrostis curvula TaxID=38414 RepID=A0A5J9T2T5_9POAL|nr:hypothetical protein EJB05_48781 [Eragrostis curvula]
MAGSPPTRKPRLAAEAAAAAAPPDLLSSLPLEVLDNILSRVHIRAVVRTSVLSRAWRGRWESLPSVDLTRSLGIVPANIDALLLRRSAPVRTFRLDAHDGSWYVDALHDWLLYLSRNGIRDLNLSFPRGNFRLHSSLFSCRELTSLKLKSCRLPPTPPGFAGFPCLKTLELCKVIVPEHGGRQLEALIGASPLLEKVELLKAELLGDDPDDEWVIRGPNLRELAIVSDLPYGGRTEDLPRLQEGSLFGPNYAKFLMGMAGVTKLNFFCLHCWPTEVDVLDKLPFLLKNVTTLVVAMNFTKMADILSIFCLLRSAPYIEDLDIWGCSDGKQEIDAEDDFLNAQWADCMFSKLRVVRMKKIVCLCNELQFVEFILSKAKVLQVLSILLSSSALCSNEEALTWITEYPRASPDAQVIFLGRESANNSSANASSENAEVDESQTTDNEHDSINTDTDDSEVDEAQTIDSEPGSVNRSAADAEAEEIDTSGSGRGSICMSPDNAEDSTQRASVNASTENAVLEEKQMTGSGLVPYVHPQRRQRLDLESVAQLEQLEDEMIELQKQVQLDLEERRLELESAQKGNSLIQQEREIMISCLQATPGLGDTAASAQGASSENVVNGASSGHFNSSQHA